ncbi:MAG: hypothetical protein EZS26_003550 [Candidatus Ordinivivax streblomastigis]|uniref:Uncharacterized protein n=1 Tax=Candidatus Ordinivivax streblomastigis TaxID=2540710 RepID=A0A5M8NXK0_9BACT|nr:MAG: hypothetical protein EZS26_003550 [Candidatus Ordinivivax streblomastigis]
MGFFIKEAGILLYFVDNSFVNKNIFIAGLEFHPVRHLQLSPNYRYFKPCIGDVSHFICLNVGFSL